MRLCAPGFPPVAGQRPVLSGSEFCLFRFYPHGFQGSADYILATMAKDRRVSCGKLSPRSGVTPGNRCYAVRPPPRLWSLRQAPNQLWEVVWRREAAHPLVTRSHVEGRPGPRRPREVFPSAMPSARPRCLRDGEKNPAAWAPQNHPAPEHGLCWIDVVALRDVARTKS